MQLLCLSVLFAIAAITCTAAAQEAAEAAEEEAVVALRGNDLWVAAPVGGRVVVDGVDVKQRIETLETEQDVLRRRNKELSEAVCRAGLVDTMYEVQRFDELAAYDSYGLEAYMIDHTHYLALGTHELVGTFADLPSAIYRWDSATRRLVHAQTISTNGIRDWEHFVIDGQHYLGAANNRLDAFTYNIPSVVYRWNATSRLMQPHQSISTSGATDLEYFEMDGDHYMAVANTYNGSSYVTPSVVYRWDKVRQQFDTFQTVNTVGNFDFEHFEISGEHYLAAAECRNDHTYDITSTIHHFNRNTGRFEPAQTVDTDGATDWEHLEVNGEHLLALSNYKTNKTYSAQSVIFKHNSTTGLWEPRQFINTLGATDWEHFVIHGVHYLTVAEHRSDATLQNVLSAVYRWNDGDKRFDLFKHVLTNGARNWAYFGVDSSSHFLAVTAMIPNLASVVYQLNSLCV